MLAVGSRGRAAVAEAGRAEGHLRESAERRARNLSLSASKYHCQAERLQNAPAIRTNTLGSVKNERK
jgi:hypothetical protein